MSEIPDRYSERLLLTADMEVWLIHWEEGHDTGFHDHDRSGGHVMVVSGTVREERLVVGGQPSSRVVSAGESFSFEPADIHRVTHVEGAPAVTIHVYSPPLHSMGAYEVTDGGRLGRPPVRADMAEPVHAQISRRRGIWPASEQGR
jgi:mannose-6-phosphate isomerase-like protein (cupin superfamily)